MITTTRRGYIKVPPLQRERATAIMLYRAGQSINNIALFLGRSTSWVYKTIKNVKQRYGLIKMRNGLL
ncbi:MAG: helix-turn-helix domain-containing protein, partial [Desulfurococcaceae archaeon]